VQEGDTSTVVLSDRARAVDRVGLEIVKALSS
jgi:hypothetical protein